MTRGSCSSTPQIRSAPGGDCRSLTAHSAHCPYSVDLRPVRLRDRDDVVHLKMQVPVDGGPGDDLLVGSRGYDILDGGPGDDTLRGSRADDRLTGGPGHDHLSGG